jgi:hypothetical protein
MSAAKAQPTPPPVEPLLLAVSDLRDTASQLREELAAVRLERRAYAEVVAERDRLIGENHEHQKAILLLLDQLFQTAGPQHAAASSNGSADA